MHNLSPLQYSSFPPGADGQLKQVKNNTDVLFVGGGPIGLWTAIQTKIRCGQGINVTVAEKYNEYQRADIRLNLAKGSIAGIPSHEALCTEVEKWFGKPFPIKSMEEGLAKIAHEVGVKVLKGHAIDPKTTTQEFPNAKVVIGSDGARSQMRKELFGEGFKFNTIHQYVVQVQYVIQPKSAENDEIRDFDRKLLKVKDLTKTYSMQKFAEHLIVQNVRPQEDGTSKVTLQIFVDKKTHDEMADATFKNPYYFESDLSKVPDTLRNTLIKWWGARETLHGEVISAEEEKVNKMTVIALGSYCAEESIKVDENGVVFGLVGDALEAFPFFRAINNGLLLGTKLSKCISAAYKSEKKSKNSKEFASHFKSYSRYAGYRASVERIRAFVKNIFIGISRIWIKSSNAVPWQSIKLNDAQKHHANERGYEIWERLSGFKAPSPIPARPGFVGLFKHKPQPSVAVAS
jgi:2-polyprenyl-6-methoxyphenol hydroxylase-like FAD-dependent oxidoreductase